MKMAALMSTVLAVTALQVFAGEGPGTVLHQPQIEGWRFDGLDVTDRMAVLAGIWERLPAEVRVYPTENYFYWQLHAGGREFRGNLRLASGQREKGLLHFGYSEWREFLSERPAGEKVLTVTGHFGPGDGVVVTCPDAFTAEVKFRGKSVRFLLNRIAQNPPRDFRVMNEEVFIERTLDESGLPFFLLFNTRGNYFLWVLNEEERPAETFHPLSGELQAGRRTGFVFWQQEQRKVLLGVGKLSVERNDYCDGPFDQLSDNYAAEVKIKDWIERAYPAHKGNIDTYGYFLGSDNPKRVALNCYLHYDTQQQTVAFLAEAKRQQDPLHFISGGGK